ncbi:hypothetical protein [Flexibacterium corallicola]|uniref:hypothetical protein n=1 Tax=Flexibacterium corallicola TaxID=3037259 RepID=UPI00286F0DB6|nr:hypothetical protein [Pseudovibrio sp. M1P-2-3]
MAGKFNEDSHGADFDSSDFTTNDFETDHLSDTFGQDKEHPEEASLPDFVAETQFAEFDPQSNEEDSTSFSSSFNSLAVEDDDNTQFPNALDAFSNDGGDDTLSDWQGDVENSHDPYGDVPNPFMDESSEKDVPPEEGFGEAPPTKGDEDDGSDFFGGDPDPSDALAKLDNLEKDTSTSFTESQADDEEDLNGVEDEDLNETDAPQENTSDQGGKKKLILYALAGGLACAAGMGAFLYLGMGNQRVSTPQPVATAQQNDFPAGLPPMESDQTPQTQPVVIPGATSDFDLDDQAYSSTSQPQPDFFNKKQAFTPSQNTISPVPAQNLQLPDDIVRLEDGEKEKLNKLLELDERALTNQIDQLESTIVSLTQKIERLEKGQKSFEKKIFSSQQVVRSPNSHSEQKRDATEKPPQKRNSTGIRLSSRPLNEKPPALKPPIVPDAHLRSVSGSTATVLIDGNYMDLTVGDRIPGAGKVNAIRKYRSQWYLITDGGLVTP